MQSFNELVAAMSNKQQQPLKTSSFDQMLGQMMQNRQQQQAGFLDGAKQLAQGVLQFQKQQRAEPFVKALNTYGQQYANAQNDTARQQANQAANAARAAFMQAGGSPYDISESLWGSDPTKGLQVANGGDNAFTPAYSGDNLTYAQRAYTQEMQQKAMESALKQATYQNIDLPLTQAQIGQAEAQTANYWRNANEPYSISGGGGDRLEYEKLVMNQQNKIEEQAIKLATKRYDELDDETRSKSPYTLNDLIKFYRTQLVNSNPQ